MKKGRNENMRTLAILAVSFGFGTCAFAQTDTMPMKNEGNFAQMKQEALKRIDERISSLNQAKTCISSAADADALKKCHAARKEEMKGMRMEMKGAKIEKIEKMQQKLENKKQKMKAQKDNMNMPETPARTTTGN